MPSEPLDFLIRRIGGFPFRFASVYFKIPTNYDFASVSTPLIVGNQPPPTITIPRRSTLSPVRNPTSTAAGVGPSIPCASKPLAESEESLRCLRYRVASINLHHVAHFVPSRHKQRQPVAQNLA